MRHDGHHPATYPALDQRPLCAHNILSYPLPSVAEEIAPSRCTTIVYVNLPPHKSGGKWVVNGGQRGGIREVNGSVLGVNRPQTNRPRAKTSHPTHPFVPVSSNPFTKYRCPTKNKTTSPNNATTDAAIVFTDILDMESSRSLISHLSAISSTHLCLCVAISDPALRAAADTAPKNAEQVYQQAVARSILEERAQVKAALMSRGITVVDAPPGRLSPAVVNEYLRLKSLARL